MTADYLHGYSPDEQKRLVSQAEFLGPWVFERIDFSRAKRVIEIGCGVGAQLAILRRRFPKAELTGIDREALQVKAAEKYLADDIAAGKVKLHQGDASRLSFGDETFDGVFLCWVLEHVPAPLPLLKEARRILAPGGSLFCTEVLNSSLYAEPHGEAMTEYWRRFNAHQTSIGGNPNMGLRVGELLADVGFEDIQSWPVVFHLDKRWDDKARRREFFDYWQAVFLSAAPSLLEAGKVDQKLIAGVEADFARLSRDPRAVFYASAVQWRAGA